MDYHTHARNKMHGVAKFGKVKGLVGPVYQSEDVSHGYSEIQKHVQRFSNLTGL